MCSKFFNQLTLESLFFMIDLLDFLNNYSIRYQRKNELPRVQLIAFSPGSKYNDII